MTKKEIALVAIWVALATGWVATTLQVKNRVAARSAAAIERTK